MIVGSQLSCAFGDKEILSNLDVHVRRGHILGIVGPGGAGKSLLIKILCGLIAPDKGHVRVDGTDLATLDTAGLAAMRERFGMLFQNYALFDFMTVGENVAFPLEQMGRYSDKEIEELVAVRLEEVGLPGVQNHFPDELSGGMKRRVSMARATIAGAPILLYDDPSGGLDPVTSSKIFTLIKRLHDPAGATVVVSHDVDRMMDVCDEWLLIHHGTVWFHGSTAAVQASTDPVVRTFFDSDDVHNDSMGAPEA